MPTDDLLREARILYQRFVIDTGFTPPETYGDLILFVELSGAPVKACESPESFDGIQIGDWVFVTASSRVSDRDRMRILAHEWCHWLRRNNASDTCYRLYADEGRAEFHDMEEEIAVAFERLF